MKLDKAKLQNVRQRGDKIIAACPACREAGRDKDGDNLAIFSDGHFACAANQGDVEHSRRIIALAGNGEGPDAPSFKPRAMSPPPLAPKAIHWQGDCARLARDAEALERLAQWRGYPLDYVTTLASTNVFGLHEGRLCFPVRSDAGRGEAVGRHVFSWGEERTGGNPKQDAWYAPAGGKPLTPLILGWNGAANEAGVMESQWDALAVLSALKWDGRPRESPFICTRGTSPALALTEALDGVQIAWLWMQRDGKKDDGSIPSEQWLARCLALLPKGVSRIYRIDPPEGFKDWNDAQKAMKPEDMYKAVSAALASAVEVVRPAVEAEADLPEPQPLSATLAPVKPFDYAWLPAPFRPWIADIAERMQCPPDYPAVAALVALSSVAGRRFCIQPKEWDEAFTEFPHLWGMLIGRPSLMKSPAMQATMRALRGMESEAFKSHETTVREGEAAAIEAKYKRKSLQSKATKAAEKGTPFDYSALIDPESEGTPCRRFIVNDASIEALGEVLRDNPTGTLLYQDELAGLLAMLNKDGNQALRAFLLQAWSGKESFTFDRIMRGTRRVEHCVLSVLGSIQPGVIASHVRAANGNAEGADGFLQRFSLMVWPDVSKDWRDVDRPLDRNAEEEAASVFQTIGSLTHDDLIKCGAREGRDGVPTLRFSPDAQARFREWRFTFETRLRDGGMAPAFEGHLGKYRKLVPALALLIHVAEWQGGAVSLSALERALLFAEYLESHAARVYGAGTIAETDAAKALWRKLRDGTAGLPDQFTAHMVRRKGWSGMNRPNDAEAACELLVDHGWLIGTPQGTTEKGGRPTVLYRVNPRAENSGSP